jgi:hypothetical protein
MSRLAMQRSWEHIDRDVHMPVDVQMDNTEEGAPKLWVDPRTCMQ